MWPWPAVFSLLKGIRPRRAAGCTVSALWLAGSTETGLETVYSNPLPHVLMLTAIVVGIATTALALALVARIHEAYGSIEEDEIHRQEVEP